MTRVVSSNSDASEPNTVVGIVFETRVDEFPRLLAALPEITGKEARAFTAALVRRVRAAAGAASGGRRG